MKLTCEKCNKEFNKSIAETFETYQVGRIPCKHCSKKNKRYISESDILMYFAASCTLYTLAVIAINFLFNLLGFLPTFVIYGLIFILFVGMYFTTKFISYFIYEKAPFKNSWKTHVLEEDTDGIRKRMKWQFIMFLLVALMLGSQPNLVDYTYLLLVTFTILIVIKVTLSLRNERNSISKGDK